MLTKTHYLKHDVELVVHHIHSILLGTKESFHHNDVPDDPEDSSCVSLWTDDN